MYDNLFYTCLEADLPIPPAWEEAGWRLLHSDDGKMCQLDRNRGWQVWMGNGPDEEHDMAYGAARMHGKCLVLGLGIGLVVQYINACKKCKSITIVERSPIVIKHIAPWLQENVSIPIEIIEGDDVEFLSSTEQKWNTMYADTWEKCTDALHKIDTLRKLAIGKVKGKKVFWCEQELKCLKKEGR